MNNYTISGNGRTFTRISKATAKKRYNSGLPVALCPVNFNPCGFWYSAYITAPKLNLEHSFDSVVNSFEYYNCNSQAGKYTAFYIVTNN